MLQKITNKSVRGPNFTVTVPDVHKVEYAEGGKIATIQIEGGMTTPRRVDWDVYAQTFSGWLPPHESEEINGEKRRQILQNVSQALLILGMPHKIVEG
jgi:hypothetical protein